MNRPSDWQHLTESDPVPGDPYEVAILTARLRRTAQAIQDQVRQLRSMCSDEFWDSNAGAAFRENAHETAGKLDRVFDRYDQAAVALSRYQPELQAAQDTSLDALRSAQDADDRRRATAQAMDTVEDPSSPEYRTLQQHHDEANDDLARAQQMLQSAIEQRDRAAESAARAIQTVSSTSRG